MGIAFLLILIGLSIWGFKALAKKGDELNKINDNNKKKIEKDYDANNFKAGQRAFSFNNDTVLAFDKNSNKICVVKQWNINSSDNFKFTTKYYSYKDLLESHIIEDGVSTTNTSRTSQIGGALVGGIIGGGVGAIIGGLSGKSTTSQTVKNLKLQIVVNDTTEPTQEITFIQDNIGESKDSEYYKLRITRINEWHNLISVLINKADKEENEKMKNETLYNNNFNINTSDEIRKLYDLFKEGIITQEEFESQKKKLIG